MANMVLLLLGAAAQIVAAAAQSTAHIFVQPIQPSLVMPTSLAQIHYSMESAPTSKIVAYETPDLPEGTQFLRIGAYDPDSASWASSVSVVSVNNFEKGFAPNIMLSLAVDGSLAAVSCQGIRVDAGQTRDFGPQSTLLPPRAGKQPSLNRPVMLSREGKKVVQEEKTFLQKYWWLIGIAVMVLTMGGGEQK